MSSPGRIPSASTRVPRFSRRDFGRTLASATAAATAAGTLGVTLWPSAADAHSAAPQAAPADARGTTLIRIGSNENPYGLGQAALAAVQAACAEANRYPFGTVSGLADRLAERHELRSDQILLSPGSGDLLRAATEAFTSPSRALVFASPTFESPERVATSRGAPAHGVPVLPSGSPDLEGMAARAEGAGLYFICNPNNPTGGICPADGVRALIARVRKAAPDAVVLLDEAYFEFVSDPAYATAVPLTRTDPRIIVTRTFSKIHGMAGLRVGYAIGHPDTLAQMRRVMGDNTLSGLSVSTALASLNDLEHEKRQAALNAETRLAVRTAFEAAGFSVLPSQGNFVMVDVRRPAGLFQAQCREAGVQVARPFPPLATHARITIGTADEMRRAMAIMLPLLRTPASAAAAMAARSAAESLAYPFKPFPPLYPFDPLESAYVC